jgi:peptide/nickel transport system permease protein
MIALIGRRLLTVLPTLFVLSILVFSLSLGIGSDRAVSSRVGEGSGAQSALAIEHAREQLELDKPIPTRYFHWLSHAVTLDFGQSFTKLVTVTGPDGPEVQGQPVAQAIGGAFPRTASLALIAIVVSAVVGLPVGIVGGVRPGSLVDRVLTILATAGLATPSFLVGMLLVIPLAVQHHLLPAVGYTQISDGGLWAWLQHLIIPGIALGLAPAAIVARQTRSAFVDVMSSTFIRTAWAKGASLPRVVFLHALRNAASAPLTVFGLIVAQLFSGVVVIETLFGISGMGGLMVNAVRSSDVPMLQACIMLFAIFTITANLLIDLLYGLLNPKVRTIS